MPRTATIDHVVPLGEGGLDHLTNVVPACTACNQLRSRETTWRRNCEDALHRYWRLLDHGMPPELASRMAADSSVDRHSGDLSGFFPLTS